MSFHVFRIRIHNRIWQCAHHRIHILLELFWNEIKSDTFKSHTRTEGPDMKEDFDFQTNLAEFEDSDENSNSDEEDDEAPSGGYSKDDFFDSISSDAQDRLNGNNNRLRGKEERTLNTETFGATSLGNNRRYRRRGGGRGRGGGGHHGHEQGDGRGRGRGGRGRNRGRGRGRGNRRYGDGMPQSGGGGGGNASDGNWRTVK